MLSTRDLSLLPPVDSLRLLSQSLAMLDAIMEPDWEFRYHSFNAHWRAGEATASMRDGSGDEYFALFNAHGAILKGFAHESPMSPHHSDPPRVWPGVLDEVPPDFASFLAEPAFSLGDTTFCIWRGRDDDAWRRGDITFPDAPDPDGSGELLAILDGEPQTYQHWAEEYFERHISLAAVRHIYAHRPLTDEVVRLLNPSLSAQDVAEDAEEIGY